MAEENRFKKYFTALAEDPNSLLNINTPSRATVSTGGLDYQAPFFGLDLTKLAPKFEDVYIGGERPATPQVDLDYLLEMARRKRMMQEARANVEGRRQELRERGMLGYEDVNDPQAAANRVYENALRLGNDINYTKFSRNFFPETRAAYDKWAASNYEDKNLRKDIDQATQRDMPGIQAKQLPGIGTAVRSSNGKAAVSGRYGVGFSMPRYTGKAIVEGAMNKKKAKA